MKHVKWKYKINVFLVFMAAIGMLIFSLIGAGSGSSTAITGSVKINNACVFSVNALSINFGTLYIGTNTIGTTNSIKVTDNGDVPSNILVSGSNWNGNLGDQYGVSNTIYNSILQGIFTSPRLSFSTTDSFISVNTLNPNTINYGTALPNTEPTGEVFSQTMNILSTC